MTVFGHSWIDLPMNLVSLTKIMVNLLTYDQQLISRSEPYIILYVKLFGC